MASVNEVILRWARLVPGWITVSGFSSPCCTVNLVCKQPSEPGHLFVGGRIEYQPTGDDALRLGSKAGNMVHAWVGGR